LECGGSPPLSESGSEPPQSKQHSKPPWPHAPVHRLTETGVYMVTAGTYRKQRLFLDGPPLRMLHHALLTVAEKHAWRLEAWTVFPNHYHFIAAAPADAATLPIFLRELHSRTAIALNRHDATPGRKVWHNYWDTRLTNEVSYLARLNYVHQNPVKHGIVSVAADYPWCSAGWFERTATPAQVKTIYSFKTDRIHVHDDY
jgi:putative transposase